MMGTHVAPRWRLPLAIVAAIGFSGCAHHGEAAERESGMNAPAVKMALVKVPLHSGETKHLITSTDITEHLDFHGYEPVSYSRW